MYILDTNNIYIISEAIKKYENRTINMFRLCRGTTKVS